ncbi:MAG TPA: hypothetical protein VM869_35335 [Enhygromyxa sp.]|nr:hypothetical protein [Enhygromyxa sp.]
MTSSLRALPLLSLVVASVFGCKPEDEQEQPPAPIAVEDAAEAFARQACKSLLACECAGSDNYSSEDDCIQNLSEHYQTEIDERLDGGASWNAECAGQLLATWSQWKCLGPNEASAQAPFDPRVCPLVKGNLGPGSECQRSDLGDNCAEGSTCVSNVCVATVVPIPLGSTCEFDWQQLPCEDGSYCGLDSSGSGERICKALPELGDACTLDEGYLCGPGSLGLVCNYEALQCELMPAVGEPCYEGFMCGPGNYCDGGKDFTCQERFDIGDGCGADSVCPVDASCINNICEADPAAACVLVGLDF